MKVVAGKSWARLRSSSLEDQDFFLKVSVVNGKHVICIDDGPPREINEDVRDWLLQEVELVRQLRADYQPRFSKVIFTVEAVGEHGSKHRWVRTSWEALEQLLKKLPGILECYVTDPARRSWLQQFVTRAREFRNTNIFRKS